jgi:site-specific DNA-cytosine methylase
MKELIAEGRPPRIIALENVCGTLTSHEGKDFAAICSTFERAGYVFGAVVIDAALFVPHSRPRLFMIGVRGDVGWRPPEGHSTTSWNRYPAQPPTALPRARRRRFAETRSGTFPSRSAFTISRTVYGKM